MGIPRYVRPFCPRLCPDFLFVVRYLLRTWCRRRMTQNHTLPLSPDSSPSRPPCHSSSSAFLPVSHMTHGADTSAAFFMRKGADVLSKWVGEAERQLRMLFEEARASQPSIIFFDEIDGEYECYCLDPNQGKTSRRQ